MRLRNRVVMIRGGRNAESNVLRLHHIFLQYPLIMPSNTINVGRRNVIRFPQFTGG